MNQFTDCTTMEALKARYEQLAAEYAVDRERRDSLDALTGCYEAAVAGLHKARGLSEEQLRALMEESEDYRTVLEKLIPIPGIIIELLGSWLWVTGDTRPVHKQLDDAGLRFSRGKAAWYYTPKEIRKQRGSGKSLDHWRTRYGSQTLYPKGRNNIQNK